MIKTKRWPVSCHEEMIFEFITVVTVHIHFYKSFEKIHINGTYQDEEALCIIII